MSIPAALWIAVTICCFALLNANANSIVNPPPPLDAGDSGGGNSSSTGSIGPTPSALSSTAVVTPIAASSSAPVDPTAPSSSAAAPAPPTPPAPYPCNAGGTLSTVCVIRNTVFVWSYATTWSDDTDGGSGSGSLILSNVTLIMQPTACYANKTLNPDGTGFKNCLLTLRFGGNITFANFSSYYGPDLTLSASWLILDSTSYLSANGAGPLASHNPIVDGKAGGGGGHGGFGGTGCIPAATGGAARGSFLAPHDYGGVGWGNNTGGGVIHIHLSGQLVLDGRISADGSNAPNTISQVPNGGGAGGSILIDVPNGYVIGTGVMSAVGGDGNYGGGGGSGGRVLLSKIDIVGVHIPVFNGGNCAHSTSTWCPDPNAVIQVGAPGTWYDISMDTVTPTAPQLKCTGLNRKGIAWTPLNISATPIPANVSIVATWCQLDMSLYPSLVVNSLTLTNSLYASSVSIGLAITANTITTTSSLIGAIQSVLTPSITITCVELNVESISQLNSVTALSITVWTAFSIGLSTMKSSLVVINAPQLVIDGSTIEGDNVYIQSLIFELGVTVASSIKADARNTDPVLCTSSLAGFASCNSDPNLPLPPIPNPFALIIQSNSFTVSRQGSISAGTMLLCSSGNMTINNAVRAAGGGCGPQGGTGQGYSTSGSPSSGAGHGGLGGMDASRTNNGGFTYDVPNNASCPGSGGGDTSFGGSGGGVIFVQVNGTLALSAGTLDASGGNANLCSGCSGAGGGSGGTISLSVGSLQTDATGVLVASGGAGGVGGGGGGGGGMIFVAFTTSAALLGGPEPTMQITGGAGGKSTNIGPSGLNGSPGTIAASPACAPGQTGLWCGPCQPGTAKNYTGYGACVACAPGTCAPMPGAATCQPCGIGAWSGPGFINCTLCAAGLAVNTNHTNCTACAPGTYSATGSSQCTLCPKGTYSQSGSPNTCPSCRGAFYSDSLGSTTCQHCPAGTYSADAATGCSACDPGRYSRDGSAYMCTSCQAGTYSNHLDATTCAKCDPGRFSYGNSNSCTPCPANTYSGGGSQYSCVACDIGTFSASGWDACLPCTDKPDHAYWIPASATPSDDGGGSGNCAYQCEAGYVESDCMTPFANLIAGVGGAGGFTALVISVTLVASAPFVYCWYRKRQKKRMQEQMENEDAAGQVNASSATAHGSTGAYADDGSLLPDPTASPGAGHQSTLGGQFFDGYDPYGTLGGGGGNTTGTMAVGSYGHHPLMDGGSGMGLGTPIRSGGMSGGASGGGLHASLLASPARPLPKHAHDEKLDRAEILSRIKAKQISIRDYALLPTEMPFHLHRIYFGGDNSFDSAFAMHPLPDAEITGLVLSDEYAKFAADCERSSGWNGWEKWCYYLICVLYYPLAPLFLQSRREVHFEQLWASHLAYDQSFLRNYRARALHDSLKLGHSKCSTLAYIDVLCYQREDAGAYPIGKPCLPMVLLCSGNGTYFTPFFLDLSDVIVKGMVHYFGPNWIKFVTSLNSMLRTITPYNIMERRALHNTLDYLQKMNQAGIGIGRQTPLGGVKLKLGYAPPLSAGNPPRLALIVMAGDRARRESQYPQPTASSFAVKPIDTGTSIAAQALGAGYNPYSSSGFTSLADAGRGSSAAASSKRSADPFASYERFDDLTTAAIGPSSHATTSTHRTSNAGPDVKVADGTAPAAGGADTTVTDVLPYGAVPIESLLDGTAPPPTVPLPVMTWPERVFRFPLRNVERKNNQKCLAYLMAILLLCHVGLIIFIAVTYSQVVPTQFALMTFIWPFAPVLMPICGFACLVSSSVQMSRSFAAFALLAICNAFVMVICGVNSVIQKWLATAEGAIVPPLLLFVDVILLFMANAYVAHLEYLRDFILSRKDYIRDQVAHSEQMILHEPTPPSP